MSVPVIFVSSKTLEPWNFNNPWTKGIGGSETSHIEMVARLKNRGYNTVSFAPIESKPLKDSNGVRWFDTSSFTHTGKGIYIHYRNPELMGGVKPKGQKWWFIAQDVDYEGRWNPEAYANVDRYICLCKDHALYTEAKYPEFRGRIYISSNGIRSDYIRTLPSIKRNYNQLFFPSSPDRGLKLLLENWFRIREINSKAILNVAYGFNNMDTIIKLMQGNDWRVDYKAELTQLLKQPGIFNLGRLGQQQMYKVWQGTNIWSHPTDFPETSCITCMEAQALGAWPVTNSLWAIKDNVKYGWMVDGVPQKSELVRSNWLHSLEQAFHSTNEKERKDMRDWALENHDWENVVTQWGKWIDEDSKK